MQKIYLVAMNLSLRSVSPTTNLMMEIAKGFQLNGCKCEIVELAAKEVRDEQSPFRVMVHAEGLQQESGFSGFKYLFNLIRGVCRFGRLVVSEKRSSEASPVVFVVSVYPIWVFFLTLVCRLNRIPIVVYIFEEWVSLLLYEETSLMKKISGCFLRIPSCLLLYGICTRLVTGVVVIVDEMRDFLVKRFFVRQAKIFIFPNIVSLDGTASGLTGSRGRHAAEKASDIKLEGSTLICQRYVVFGGNLSFTKDAVAQVLAAIRILREEGVYVGLRIYGKVGDSQLKRLHLISLDLGISEHITVMGFVEQYVLEDDLSLAVASLVIKNNTPFNRYNFPTKMMDALRLNVPLVLSTNTLFLKYFKNRYSACIVDPESAADIASAVKYLIEHPRQSRTMAVQARKLLEDEFNGAAVCRRFLNFIAAKC